MWFFENFPQFNSTGAAEESKDKTDQSRDPEVEEEQTQPNEADDNEEGNLDDEGATGEQEQQQSQDPEEVEDLDLPDDLQLDGDGREDNDGRFLVYFLWWAIPWLPCFIFSQAKHLNEFSANRVFYTFLVNPGRF